jgi:hypothetical protein
MSIADSRTARYLKRRTLKKLVAKAGAAKLAAAAAIACLVFVLFLALLAALAGASSSEPSAGSGERCSEMAGKDSPPEALVPIYAAAAQRFELGPRGPSILAAINKVESDFGRSMLPGVQSGTNSAGAAGPMQFLFPSSWEAFGVDGNGDHVKDVYDPTDAIFSAANLLAASGAPGDWYGAIFSYNHADWYVREVLQIARGFGSVQCVAPSPLGQLPSAPLQRIEYIARWIQAQRIPYCWGGGHGAKPGPSPPSAVDGYCVNTQGDQVRGSSERGLDCSGAVRWLLALTYSKDPGALVSGQFAGAFPSGPGEHVTIWSNAEHVFVSIDGVDWGTASSHFRHGPGFGYQPTASFVASHPAGL